MMVVSSTIRLSSLVEANAKMRGAPLSIPLDFLVGLEAILPISDHTVLKRYQVQCIEVEKLRSKSIVGTGMNTEYTDYVTCQGTHPARLSGKDHKKCGRRVSMSNAYKCLYCSFWFCLPCAEKHFGKTKEQYQEEL